MSESLFPETPLFLDDVKTLIDNSSEADVAKKITETQNIDYLQALDQVGSDKEIINRLVTSYPKAVEFDFEALRSLSEDNRSADGVAQLVFEALPAVEDPSWTYDTVKNTVFNRYKKSKDPFLKKLNAEEAFIHRFVNDVRNPESLPETVGKGIAEGFFRTAPNFIAAVLASAGVTALVAGSAPVTIPALAAGILAYGGAELTGAGKKLAEDIRGEKEADKQVLPSAILPDQAAKFIGETLTFAGLPYRMGTKAAPYIIPARDKLSQFVNAPANPSSLDVFRDGIRKSYIKSNNNVDKFFASIGSSAQSNPYLFGGVEALSTVGGGFGSGIAAQKDPGDLSTAFAAEFVGSTFVPGRFIVGLLPTGINAIKNTYNRALDVPENKASKEIFNAVEAFVKAENSDLSPEQFQKETARITTGLTKALKEDPSLQTLADEAGIDQTIKQTTAEAVGDIEGADVIRALTKYVIKADPERGASITDTLQKNAELVSELTDTLFNLKDGALLSNAAKVRYDIFKNVLNNSILRRLDDVSEKTKKVVGTPEEGTQASEAILNAMDEFFRFARQQEDKLYGSIKNKKDRIKVSSTLNKFNKILDQFVQTGLPPDDILNFMSQQFKRRPVPEEIKNVFKEFTNLKNRLNNGERKLDLSFVQVKDFAGKFDFLDKDFNDFKYLQAVSDDLLKPIDEREIIDLQYLLDNNIAPQELEEGRDLTGRELRAVADMVTQKIENISLKRKIQEEGKKLDSEEGLNNVAKLKEFIMGATDSDTAEIPLDVLINFRSKFLRKARKAKDDPNQPFYYQMAEAIQKDIFKKTDELSKIQEAGGALTEDQQALITAYAYSASLNDVFRRGTARFVTDPRSQAEPEQIVNQVFRGESEVVGAKINAMMDVARFIGKEGLGEKVTIPSNLRLEFPEEILTGVNDALKTIIKSAASGKFKVLEEVSDPSGGTRYIVNAGRLKVFREKYASLLKDNFPELYDDLSSAETARRLFDERKGTASEYVLDKLPNKNLKIFNFYNRGLVSHPSAIIADLFDPLNSRGKPRSAEDLLGLIKNIKNPRLLSTSKFTSKELNEALVESIVQRAWISAGGNNKKFNFNSFNNYLNTPLSTGKGKQQTSIINLLRQEKVLSDTQWFYLNKLLKQGEVIEKVITSGPQALSKEEQSVIQGAGAAFTALITKIVGASAGSQIAKLNPLRSGGSTGLIEASAGVRAIETVLDKVPTSLLKNILFDAIEDPQLMARLLENRVSEKQGLKIANYLRSYYITTATGPLKDRVSEEEQQKLEEELKKIDKEIGRNIMEKSFSSPYTNSQLNIPPRPSITAPRPSITAPPAQKVAQANLGPFDPAMAARFEQIDDFIG